jgi:hypothetical protein
VQIDGDAQVLHMPKAADGLVDYFRRMTSAPDTLSKNDYGMRRLGDDRRRGLYAKVLV